MVMRLKVKPVNVLVVQVYAPCDVEGSVEKKEKNEEEKDRFYERLDQVIEEYRKGRECLVVMGDFNGKVGEGREEDTVGPYGLGERNDNGERVVNFLQEAQSICNKHLVSTEEVCTAYLDITRQSDKKIK